MGDVAKAKVLKISAIHANERHRKDMGDIRSLADSIEARGLLQPIVVRPDGTLVAGKRRIEAVKLLDRDKIAAVVVNNLNDALDLLKAELDENTCRKDFAPSEAVALAESLRPLEEEEAKRRHDEQAKVNLGVSDVGKLPPSEKGRTRDKVASVVGMSGKTYERAREVVEAAKVEPEKFGPLVEKMDKTGKVNGAHKRMKVMQQAEEIRNEPPPVPQGPFRVIAIDPPWSYGNREEDVTHRTANPYPSMSTEEIKALDIPGVMEPDSIVWLWTTNAHMPDAFEILKHWGFQHKTILTWVKDRMGTGDWLRGKTEHCIFAVRGKPTVTLTNQTTIIDGPLREHSRKPDSFYDLVTSLCPGSKCELFSRKEREGWTTHGDESTLFS